MAGALPAPRPEAKARRVWFSPDGGSLTHDATEFSEFVRMASVEILSLPEYKPLTSSFLAAYDYRSRIPWLSEAASAIESIDSGLTLALQLALGSYVPSGLDTANEGGGIMNSDRDLEGELDLDAFSVSSEWNAEAVVGFALDDERIVRDFAVRLELGQVDLTSLGRDEVRYHVEGAISQYASRFRFGTSPDPW